MTIGTAGNAEGDDDLKSIVDALVDAQKQIANMSPEDRMALGEALATALREARMLARFELTIARESWWKIDARPLALRVDDAPSFGDDIPF